MKFIFINPYAHHAYFSILALSRLDDVEILCPPFIIDLLLRRWKTRGLRLHYSAINFFFISPILVFVYWSKQFGLFSDKSYIKIFVYCASLLLRCSGERVIIYCYQDYLLNLIKQANSSVHFIVEFIIQFPRDQPNSDSSIEVAHLATAVTAPTKLIVDELVQHGIQASLTPYGGDKLSFRNLKSRAGRKTSIFYDIPANHVHEKQRCDTFLIAARSNSLRKGMDILLEALDALDQDFPDSSFSSLEVIICGNVTDPYLANCASRLSKQFNASGKVRLRNGQLNQDNYLQLLKSSDIFVMPSRLEGSSYAALEALWQGVPSVLSPFCGVEMFKPAEHGELLDPLTSDSLEKILREILIDPDRLDNFRFSLERDQHLFTWERYTTAVSDSVQQVLKLFP